MSTAFSSWSAFFAMGGYAFYVWLSVAVTFLSLFALVVHTLWQRRKILHEVIQRQAREERIAQSKLCLLKQDLLRQASSRQASSKNASLEKVMVQADEKSVSSSNRVPDAPQERSL